jgi:ADP-ribose pyrophosphatase
MPGRIAESALEAFGGMPVPTGNRKPDTVLYIVLMPKFPRSQSKPAKTKTSSNSKARLISSRTVYRGPVFWVTTDDVQEPGGVRARRDVIHHTGSVVVLAVDESGATPHVLLERQYRHAANGYLWELPAGRIDPGEKALHAAKRELLEETGYTASHWRRILNFYASPGFVAETMSVYLATGLSAGPAQPEADEVIHKRLVSLPTAIRMVLRGTIRDAKTISSVLWLDHQLVTRKGLQSPRRRRQAKL